MAESVLVFISHPSSDKESLIEPVVIDLEDCYINVWLDKRKIAPGENLRKSIFRDGLDKADIALIFFTQHSLKSSWVDKEIKHVLREDLNKGNDFNLNKIISIFDSEETYKQIAERYPELTDDLLHLMPLNYSKLHLGQLISAIWSKYFSLKGDDIETQKKILSKDREIFKHEMENESLKRQIEELKSSRPEIQQNEEFLDYYDSGITEPILKRRIELLGNDYISVEQQNDYHDNITLELIQPLPNANHLVKLTKKGKEYFKWILKHERDMQKENAADNRAYGREL
jgi:hypothetical protein